MREGREGDERETRERVERTAERKRQRRAKRERAAAVSQAASRRKSRGEGRRALEIIVNDKTKHGAIGLSTRSRRLRHCPLGRESGIECARAHDLALVQSGSTGQLALSPPLPSLSVPGRRLLDYCEAEPLGGFHYGVPRPARGAEGA